MPLGNALGLPFDDEGGGGAAVLLAIETEDSQPLQAETSDTLYVE